MKTLPVVLLAVLSAPTAWAQTSAEALDLSLPNASAYANDPPGTWYGDRNLPAKRTADVPQDPCQVMYDDRDGDGITGSVTTGIGYSKGHGRSTYNAANLNLCKSYTDDDGDTRTFNFNIHMDRYDGPGYYSPGYRGAYPSGPMMRGAPRP